MKSSDKTFRSASAEESSGFLLWQVTSVWQREIRKALDPLGISHSQFVLLASIHWLTLQKEDVTQVLLSNHTKIDAMTTSTVLRTLQSKGFVTRTEHSTDTRAKVVSLTEEGKKVMKKAVAIVEDFDHVFFSSLQSKLPSFNQHLLTLLKS